MMNEENYLAVCGKNILDIKDIVLEKCAIRVDKANEAYVQNKMIENVFTLSTWNHINLNPRSTNLPDSHTQISAMTMQTAKMIRKAAKYLQVHSNIFFVIFFTKKLCFFYLEVWLIFDECILGLCCVQHCKSCSE